MPAYPSLSTQVIGQAESALGAVLVPDRKLPPP